MGLQELYTLLEKHGIKGGVIIFIVGLLFVLHKTGLLGKIVTYLSEKYIEFFISKKDVKSQISDVTISDILNHDIFNYIDFWRYSRVPTFQFSSDYRTIVFRKYLSIYLKCQKENLQKYINGKTYLEMDNSELWRSLLILINDTVFDYEKEMLNSGIPKIVIDKMKVKNNDIIQLTIDLIEGICNSPFYKSENNLLKVYSILNIILSVLDNTIQNSEHVCNTINGQLKGLSITENGVIYSEP